jgi:hypothetical protein
MPRIPVNSSCNVLTQPHVRNPRAKAEITVPRFRLNLSPSEAEALAADLTTAVTIARGIEAGSVSEVDGKAVN